MRPGRKRWSFSIPSWWSCTDKGHEEGIRKHPYLTWHSTGEMEVFTQFASDLDDATKAQLAHGKALMELLKQPLCHPLSLHEQVMTLIMANNGVFDTIETKEVKKYQSDILSYMDLSYPEIGQKIEENRAIDDELVNKIMDAVKSIKGNR